MEAVVGLFRRIEEADEAVKALELAGIDKDRISLLARNSVVEGKVRLERPAKDVAESAGLGAVTGGVVGGILGMLASVGAIIIPGLGAAVAAGTLATALGISAGSAGVGAAVGGILGAMTGLSIPEEEAHIYAEGVKRGGILVMVQAEGSELDEARRILKDANAMDLHALREQLRKEGWERFDETQEVEVE